MKNAEWELHNSPVVVWRLFGEEPLLDTFQSKKYFSEAEKLSEI